MQSVKTRFCPSPTGYIHIGNLRTALFNALFAHSQSEGHFLLRIEDTDRTRSYDEYTAALMSDLQWLGVNWQEGAGVEPEGDNGPYWQSKRQAIYNHYYDILLEKSLAFPCFCTEEQLMLNRKVQRAAKQPPRYPGTCRHLTPDQIAQKREQGLKETLRFCVPDDQIIEFTDLVKGKQRFSSSDISDFIIRRADGSSPFMYSNALDDSLMGVTHAFRGDDHLTNTPRQLLILRSLNLREPDYGHLSLITGDDGLPLSKRNGSCCIRDLQQSGYLPIAILNYIARLGHTYGENALLSLNELAEQFSIDKLSTSPARFELSQLQFWQKEAVMQLSKDAFGQWVGDVTNTLVPATQQELFYQTIMPNVLFPDEAIAWAKRLYQAEKIVNAEHHATLSEAGDDFFTQAMICVEQHDLDYAKLTSHLKTNCQVKGKALFQPLRLALTGQSHGPELAPLLQLMGKENVLKRFEQARLFIQAI